MSFKRNSRMPAYIWGGCQGTPDSWTPRLPGSDTRFAPAVPIGERLIRVIFPSSGAPRTQSDSPCDLQIPWLQFGQPFLAGSSVERCCLALTMFGEAYFFSDTDRAESSNPFLRERKIVPVRIDGVGKPFSRLAFRHLLTTDKKVWHIDDPTEPPLQCSFPSGASVASIGDLVDLNVGTSAPRAIAIDENGSMYWTLRNDNVNTPTTFRKFTKWVSGLQIDDPGAYVTDGQQPLTFEAPPAGGKTAEGVANIVDGVIASVQLTHPGWGYDEAPKVTVVGSGKVSATLFNDVPFSYCNRIAISSANTIVQLLSGTLGDYGQFYGNNWRSLVRSNDNGRAVGIKNNGELWAYGNRWYGNASSTPAKIADGKWLAVAVTAISAAAIRDDYTLWTWGLNFNGTLGDSTDPNARRELPVQIASGVEWVDVFGFGSTFDGTFIAIRKDSQRRSNGQAFEFWPDSYFGG